MKKKIYYGPTSQVICLHLEDTVLSTSPNVLPPKWEEGENDWFSSEPVSEDSKSNNYWN